MLFSLRTDFQKAAMVLCSLQNGTHCHLLGVHVTPKGGRRDPALRAESAVPLAGVLD
jgi:hypothetical protein